MNYYLDQYFEPSGDNEGFYVLRGCTNWSSIEGFASEWLAIAQAILKNGNARARRCAVYPDSVGFTFHSPRNCSGERDVQWLDREEAGQLAASITNTLRECGEKCVFGDYDPILLGA